MSSANPDCSERYRLLQQSGGVWLVLRLANSATAVAWELAPKIKSDPRRKCQLLILAYINMLLVVADAGVGLG